MIINLTSSAQAIPAPKRRDRDRHIRPGLSIPSSCFFLAAAHFLRQWSASIHLVKGDAGFSGTVKVPWGQKIAYKFVVDGIWRCRDDRPKEDDGSGNINNVLRTPENPLHDPLARLSIPPVGYGDVDHMVTAVEYLSPVEFTIKGPLPVPQITVEGLEQALSDDTSVSESKPV